MPLAACLPTQIQSRETAWQEGKKKLTENRDYKAKKASKMQAALS
jgi:hypothetical protein